ncbi:hypothetical protein P153DRAFT_191624 [Dothidotthia symphoricarpi CBS 119687]|uniref:Pyridoxamine 5'-phosphate oxidase N-terminal domain-containing protein n=1 Tax=Dothidotthia symphoricarpi CBS 119687 TaxID=1392245 RepID=A0A6A6AJJ2_9PLEO|nr:uncharacterized protein P153DRAFT_191624 [Dothidotthia symphoricarpi CBS 119687]KAF2131275.1 hypothetical protein P153DRAFT_191624 [Dothidotthia symphoricarpi CBS 119687]
MVKFHDSLDQSHVEFITSQPLFFVASAPWAGSHINISPKAHPSKTFSILGPNTVAYLDATGSGCETISHVYENGRVTLMFSSFGPSPKIIRLYCTGRVIEKWDQYYQELRAKMATENGDEVDFTGARAVIVLRIKKVQTSCGFALPADGIEGDATAFADHEHSHSHDDVSRPRETLEVWSRKKLEKQEMADYQKNMNHRSLDGLPGLMSARRTRDENFAVEDTKAWLRKVNKQQDAVALGIGFGVLLMLVLHVVGVLHIQPKFLYTILEYQKRHLGIVDTTDIKSEL